MPYKNVPESLWPDMESCTAKLKDKGESEESAIAMCYSTIVEGKEVKAEFVEAFKATWTAASINNLPDSSFGHIESGGTKDEGGKTTPRSLRHLPYKNADGSVDLPHLRNAISRLGQATTDVGGLSEAQKTALQGKLQKILDKETGSSTAGKGADSSAWTEPFAKAILANKEGYGPAPKS